MKSINHGTLKNQLEIKTQSGKYLITGQDINEFPSDPVMSETISITINTKELIEIIDFTKTSVSKDELKPAIQGVLLKIDNTKILGVSTDGHRLSRIIIKNNTEQTKEHEIIIPTKFLNLISSFIKKAEKIELEISKNYISIFHKDLTIFSRIIKDTYPDYEKVIPLDNDKQLSINKTNLINAIKRVSIFSNRATKQINLKTINTKEVILSTEDAEKATKGKETISCNYSDSEEFKIGFNAHFLLESLHNIKKEEITIFLKGPLSAAVITEKNDKENTDKLLLLMPIRLND